MREDTSANQKILVLHVDDDPCFLEISKEILESEGKFQVENAQSVDDALQKLTAQPFQAVISDYEMPQKNGLQFLEEIRQKQKNEIAFVMFTGRGREEVAVKALNLGADRYIQKNGDPETVFCELSYALTKIVERKRARRTLLQNAKKINELNEKLRVVGSLTRHDVRNKLTSLNGQVYLLKKRLKDDPESLKRLQDIEVISKQIVELLEFSHLYERLGVEELKMVDVEKIVNEALALFTDIKGVQISNQCGKLTVQADSLLRQLFYNLVDNSLRHGEKTTSVCIRYEVDSEKTRIIYEDNGVGVPNEHKASLFEEKNSHGINHGLYVARRICEAYGWTLEESGTAGEGARFVMCLPKQP